MNLVSRLLSIGTLLLAPAAFAADAFEGKIEMTMTASNSKDKPQVMVYTVRSDATRIDLKGQPISMIYNLPKHESLILMHEQKMYMTKVIEPSDIPAKEGKESDRDAKPEHASDIEATGKTETICGYTCNQFLVKDGKNLTEMWLAEGLGSFMGMGSGGTGGGGGMGGMFGKKKSNAAAAAKWETVLKGKGGFPMRVISHDSAGKDTFKMEATKVEKGGVTNADFTAPAGYSKFQMPNLGDMLKGIGG